MAVCKIKAQFLPVDLSAWEAGNDTAESNVKRVVERPASSGLGAE